MNYSLNLDLLEPTPGDQYNIDHFNQNAEILDEHIHNLEESSDALSQALNTGLSAERAAREAGDEASKQFDNMQGICPVAKGGTGSTTKQDAIDNLFSEIPQLLSVNDSDMFTFLRSGSVKKTTLDIFVRKLYELIKPMVGSTIETAMILPFASEFGTAQEPYKFVPEGFFACDGRAVSRVTYAKLFERTGIKYGSGDGITTFNVPDFRECALVGAGQNWTNSIATHDIYALGQFKDDQIQNITGYFYTDGYGGGAVISVAGGAFSCVDGTNSSFAGVPGNYATRYAAEFNASRVARAGSTTRGKRKAVNFIIKY